MTKDEYKQLMILSIYGEVNDEERSKLEKYLASHPELKTELKELQQLKSIVSAHAPDTVSDEVLHDARMQLRTALRKERQRRSMFTNVGNMVGEFFQSPAKLAIGGAAMLVLGIVIGHYTISLIPEKSEAVVQQVLDHQTVAAPGTRISNVRFIDADASDGIVEFEFDAVAPMHVKGRITDPEVQKILTYALLSETNDGVRLRTVNAIGRQTDDHKEGDPAIKSALIISVKNDGNPGVRREALRVLQQYPFDNDIRDAMLFVLSHDSNSGIRVSAINALQTARIEGKRFDTNTITALKKQMATEQNNYVRNRTANLVKEIYQ